MGIFAFQFKPRAIVTDWPSFVTLSRNIRTHSSTVFSTAQGLIKECCIRTLTRRSRHRWQPVLVFLWNSFACFFPCGCDSCGFSSRPPTRGSVVVIEAIIAGGIPDAAQLKASKLNDDEGRRLHM